MANGKSLFTTFLQLFLVFTFLCAPIADSAHALKMPQTKQDTAKTLVKKLIPTALTTAKAQCHEPAMIAVNTAASDSTLVNKLGDKKPCCPYKQCSPANCLTHTVITEMASFEMIFQSPNDTQVFLAPDIHLVPVLSIEHLRPPIA